MPTADGRGADGGVWASSAATATASGGYFGHFRPGDGAAPSIVCALTAGWLVPSACHMGRCHDRLGPVPFVCLWRALVSAEGLACLALPVRPARSGRLPRPVARLGAVVVRHWGGRSRLPSLCARSPLRYRPGLPAAMSAKLDRNMRTSAAPEAPSISDLCIRDHPGECPMDAGGNGLRRDLRAREETDQIEKPRFRPPAPPVPRLPRLSAAPIFDEPCRGRSRSRGTTRHRPRPREARAARKASIDAISIPRKLRRPSRMAPPARPGGAATSRSEVRQTRFRGAVEGLGRPCRRTRKKHEHQEDDRLSFEASYWVGSLRPRDGPWRRPVSMVCAKETVACTRLGMRR